LTLLISGLLLVPVKAGFLEVTQDDVKGRWITSMILVFFAVAFFNYVLLLVCILFIVAGLHVVTGMKWEPASFASRLAILHMFNSEQVFAGAEFIPGDQILQIHPKVDL
jgi:hypothetical protein